MNGDNNLWEFEEYGGMVIFEFNVGDMVVVCEVVVRVIFYN